MPLVDEVIATRTILEVKCLAKSSICLEGTALQDVVIQKLCMRFSEIPSRWACADVCSCFKASHVQDDARYGKHVCLGHTFDQNKCTNRLY